jgi:hypothetical protein
LAYLKQLVYEDNWKTESLDILIERIREKIKSIPQNVIKKFFRGIKRKVRLAANYGPLSKNLIKK